MKISEPLNSRYLLKTLTLTRTIQHEYYVHRVRLALRYQGSEKDERLLKQKLELLQLRVSTLDTSYAVTLLGRLRFFFNFLGLWESLHFRNPSAELGLFDHLWWPQFFNIPSRTKLGLYPRISVALRPPSSCGGVKFSVSFHGESSGFAFALQPSAVTLVEER